MEATPRGRIGRIAELAYFAGEYAIMRFAPRDKPGRVLGALFRMPLLQQRLGLDKRLSETVLFLETTGRKTGLTRTTPLGFVHVPDTDTYFVSAGWYGKTDWYRNLRANPRVRVHHGRRTFACEARPISDDEAVPVIRRTVDRNPFALRLWERWTDQPLDGSDDSLRVVARAFPTVALQAPSGTP
jgi:deazaflavin-dependent oxidoreductase (nitroreductase family)